MLNLIGNIFGSLLASVHILAATGAESPSPAASMTGADPDRRASNLNLPADFMRHIRSRALLDAYSEKFHSVEQITGVTPVRPIARRRSPDQFVRVVRPELGESVLNYRLSQAMTPSPLRGFLAPILARAGEARSPVFRTNTATEAQQAAAAIIDQRLAHDGLLATLVRVIEILGAARVSANPRAAMAELWMIGFPVDWIGHFQIGPPDAQDPNQAVAEFGRRLSQGESVAALRRNLEKAKFQFRKSGFEFRVAEESGEEELGMLRIHIGGGYAGGIVPGGSIDLASQLVTALPEVDFIIATPEEFFTPLSWMAQNTWPVKRRDHVTFIVEKGDVTPWGQDNGKAGVVVSGTSDGVGFATLAPRFASRGEDDSIFTPGDSFVMDGLQASGHRVIHSPLLFQGGNLLPVRDPATGQRVMLIGEAEVYRNTALGLTREQALEAFRVEFAVDDCVVLPVASHHLDFDVSVRAHRGRLIAFVNDTFAAARLILRRGTEAVEQSGSLSSAQAQEVRAGLDAGEDDRVCHLLTHAVQTSRNVSDRFPPQLVERFATLKTDSSTGNFRCFLTALDILTSAAGLNDELAGNDFTRRYFQALREMQAAERRLAEVLEKLGWRIVRVPSMPDLHRSINYLNGIHDRSRYVMPAYGGFYEPADQAALRAFEQALGPEVKIVRIYCAASQRTHGAVHCAASAYPRLTTGKTP